MDLQCMAFRVPRTGLPREERTSPGREGPKMRRATRSATTSSDPPVPPKPTAAHLHAAPLGG